MNIDYSRAFLKTALQLPKKLIGLVEEKELIFKNNPFHPSLRTHKLHGKEKEVWAFSINYHYRIKFVFLADKHVLFMDIGLHDIYK